MIIDKILLSEGWPKFTNDVNDIGGPTKGGITIKTLSEYRGKPVSINELEELTEDEARKIYEQMYITRPQFDKIRDEKLRNQVIDAGVLHGTTRVTKWLQEIVNTNVDGRFGIVSQAFVNEADSTKTNIELAVKRIRFIGSIVENNHEQAKWVNGWLTRATSFLLSL